MTWEEFKNVFLMDQSVAAASSAIYLSGVAADIKSGCERWKYEDLLAAVEGNNPSIAALLQRNAHAAQMLSDSYRELRSAIVAAVPAKPSAVSATDSLSDLE